MSYGPVNEYRSIETSGALVPDVVLVPPTISITQNPSTPKVGDTVIFTAQSTDSHTIEWASAGVITLDAVLGESVTSVVDSKGEYTVTGTAKGDGGESSDSITYTVEALSPPVANAGQDLPNIAAGSTFQLSGNGVATEAGATIESYFWEQIEGISGALEKDNAASVEGTAPTTSSEQLLTYELTVTDSNGKVGKDTVNVYVNAEVLESRLSVYIKGAANGVEKVNLFNVTDIGTSVFYGDATILNETLSVTVPVSAGTQLVGLRLGNNFPDTGGGFQGRTV